MKERPSEQAPPVALALSSSRGGPSRLHSLDALRGIAALAVVFWHWQHFWPEGGLVAEDQPFYDVFRIFYNHGLKAVDLFFCLSGFIFFWLYSGKIERGAVSTWRFFWLRVSRLYPLHLLTLLVVAIGQIVFTSVRGEPFVYSWNDARHFVLNLSMLQGLGLEQGYSFNNPSWSISVEAMLYAVFFAACRLRMTRWFHLLSISVAGLALIHLGSSNFGRGLASFFLGGIAFSLYRWILGRPSARRELYTAVTAASTAIAWALLAYALQYDLAVAEIPIVGWLAPIWRASHMPTLLPTMMFPSMILSLALIEARGLRVPGWLTWLGDVSYSSYLWHFPLQLAFALAVPLASTPAAFRSPAMLIGFYAALIPLSLASDRFFERPAQRALRDALKPWEKVGGLSESVRA
ncbi:MAG: acyltransferase [Isosphaeraceae bacterium]